MTGNNVVLDSNILIYLSKGELDFKKLIEGYDSIFISVVSYMEALGFDFKDEEEKSLIEKLLTSIEIIQTDMEIANSVIIYRKLKKVKTPDAIILATAKKLNADLLTVNIDDFGGLDSSVKIINPF
jgi:predicted nucleic acid-binding protein